MTIKTMGIRDLVREGKTVGDEVIKIQNKKTGKIIGIFVPPQYSKKVERLIAQEKKRRWKKFMSFAGMANGLFPKETKAIQKIKSQME